MNGLNAPTGPLVVMATNDEIVAQRFIDLLSANGEVRIELRRGVVGEPNLERAMRRLLAEDPAVVIIGPDAAPGDAIVLTKRVLFTSPTTAVILVGDPERGFLMEAMRAGARDVLPFDATVETVRASILRCLEALTHWSSDTAPSGGSVITVISPKGGTGKTTVTTNMAFALTKRPDTSVFMVDLDVQFGDIGNFLHLRSDYTAIDAARKADDILALKGMLVAHPAGPHVLLAPETPIEADNLDPEAMMGALRTLRREADFLLIDTAAGLDEFTLAAIELADVVVLITTGDVAAVVATRKAIEALNEVGLDTHRRIVALNRAGSKTRLSPQSIEQALGCRLDLQIPNSTKFPLSLNDGLPLTAAAPASREARAVDALVDMVAQPDPHGEKKRFSFLGWQP